MTKLWRKWFDKQPLKDRLAMGLTAIERLLEIHEVSFRIDDCVNIDGTYIPEEEVVEEFLYWTNCGENILEDQPLPSLKEHYHED